MLAHVSATPTAPYVPFTLFCSTFKAQARAAKGHEDEAEEKLGDGSESELRSAPWFGGRGDRQDGREAVGGRESVRCAYNNGLRCGGV